ncbi:MAG: hypothetical protein F6K31_28875 [Symploca sp. SIO2G7]|nr:hypothetical protein [Symploca sp. SIO2G7]
MEITKEKRKIVVPLSGAPLLGGGGFSSPRSPNSHPRVPASGASLDNDTFTLTCHQCLVIWNWELQ